MYTHIYMFLSHFVSLLKLQEHKNEKRLAISCVICCPKALLLRDTKWAGVSLGCSAEKLYEQEEVGEQEGALWLPRGLHQPSQHV